MAGDGGELWGRALLTSHARRHRLFFVAFAPSMEATIESSRSTRLFKLYRGEENKTIKTNKTGFAIQERTVKQLSKQKASPLSPMESVAFCMLFLLYGAACFVRFERFILFDSCRARRFNRRLHRSRKAAQASSGELAPIVRPHRSHSFAHLHICTSAH